MYRQISGREMFEFNPELIEGDDDEADDVAYQREPQDEVWLSLLIKLTLTKYYCLSELTMNKCSNLPVLDS